MKNYTLTLTAVTPFHIGSGVKYSKKEYAIDRQSGTVTLFDMEKVMGWIVDQRRGGLADAFEAFMLSKNDNDILAFLNRIGMPPQKQKECKAYSFKCGGALRGATQNRDLMPFVRDARGFPYVPGSSLKGALRTVLLVKMLLDGKFRGSAYIRDAKRDPKKFTETIETALLHTLRRTDRQENALNSVMSGISISDSAPFDKSQITLAVKADVGTDGGARPPIPLFRECAAPGTQIPLSLTLSDDAERMIGIDYIRKAIRGFDDYYLTNYLGKFPKPFTENLDDCIFIGGGCGYFSKNIVYPYFRGDVSAAVQTVSNIMACQFPQHRHEKDNGLGISPRMLKCTDTDGRTRQLGICRVEIEEKK